jgi:CDP-diacylglycerol pyrophosphatase
MSKVVKVEAVVSLYITVPDETTKDDVYSFVANNVSYRDAFLGVADDVNRITDVIVVDEEIRDMNCDDTTG